jgi:hypothetical protein
MGALDPAHLVDLVVVGQKAVAMGPVHLGKVIAAVMVCTTVVAVAVVLMKWAMLARTKVMPHMVMVVMVNYHQLQVHLSEEPVVVVLVESPHEVDMVGLVVVVMEVNKHQVEPQQQTLAVVVVDATEAVQEVAALAL